MNTEFENVGGHIWSLIEKDESGYDKTIVSIEIKNSKIYIFEQGRPLSILEFEKLINLIKPILI